MEIEWSVLGQVAAVSIGLTVALVAVFTTGIVLASGKSQQSTAGGSTAATGPSPLHRSVSYLCFALCAAAVAYGIWLITA